MSARVAELAIEQRPDGSVLLTERGGPPWAVAVTGMAGGCALLGAALVEGVTLVGGVLVLPLALIALLSGVAALRHRDWIHFDRPAREIAFRRGLRSMFRPARVMPFAEVEAIVVGAAGPPHPPGGSALAVELLRADEFTWQLEISADPVHVGDLVAALHAAGDWPVLRAGVRLAPPYRFSAADARP